VGLKQSQSAVTTADLSGTYELATQESSGDKGSLRAITFDGAGNIDGSGKRNDAGPISIVALTGTNCVAADGTLTVIPTGGKPLTGSVSVDGQKTLLTSLNDGGSPSIWLGVFRALFDPWGY